MSDIDEVVDVVQTSDGCPRSNLRHSCEVFIDFTTRLIPPPRENTVTSEAEVEVEIEKVCVCKVLLTGILHKTIRYDEALSFAFSSSLITKHKDIPFSCYIDVSDAMEDDQFEIVGSGVICSDVKVDSEEEHCSDSSVLRQWDIIKIIIQRVS